MNITAVSMNSKGVIPQAGTRAASNNYTSAPSLTSDTFQKSVSFGSKESVILSTDEGIKQLLLHFTIFKSYDPQNANKIDMIKDFILEVNRKARKQMTSLKVSYEQMIDNEGLKFNNMKYTFENGTHSFIKKPTRYGSANSLYDLIVYCNKQNEEIRKAQADTINIDAVKKLIEELRQGDQYDLTEADALESLYIDKTADCRQDAAGMIINTINDSQNKFKSTFDEIFPDRP